MYLFLLDIKGGVAPSVRNFQLYPSFKNSETDVFSRRDSYVKLQVNGSIFKDDQIDSTSQLAKERVELVKDPLVKNGVKESSISVSTNDDFEGSDEAERAVYARSATVAAVE